jgi:hypothetical protein
VTESKAEHHVDDPDRNPYVFIVGCQRSGTTLLRRMVDANPHIAIIHESRWIPDFYHDRVGMTPEGRVSRDLIPPLLEHKRFPNLEMSREDLEGLVPNGSLVPYPRFVAAVFDLYAKRRDKRLAGDKTPSYVRSIPVLHALFPEAKFVHIIRDGRDVCLSAINWRSGGELRRRFVPLHDDTVTTNALWWDWLVRTGRETGSSLEPDLYHEVRYEALVSDPGETCRKLCAFLAIPYHDAMLRFHEGRERPKPGRSAKNAWLRVTEGLRDWRTEMSPEEICRFEAAAGDLLEDLGYERSCPRPGKRIFEKVARARETFAQELLARDDRPPRSWER